MSELEKCFFPWRSHLASLYPGQIGSSYAAAGGYLAKRKRRVSFQQVFTKDTDVFPEG